MLDLNSIFALSTECKMKGSLVTDKRLEKMLGITYQYVLLSTLKENGINVSNILYVERYKFALVTNLGTFIIDNNKQSSAFKVKEYILKQSNKNKK